MNFELTKEYLEQLEHAIDSDNKPFVLENLEGLHAADVSSILNKLDARRSQFILEVLNTEIAAEIISDIDEEIRGRFLKNFSPQQIGKFLDYIDSDDAADILNELPVEFREQIISNIQSDEKVEYIVDLLRYDEDCAGGLMAKEMITANVNWTVKQCIDEIRRQAENVEKIYSIYVIDDKNMLLGRVALKQLILTGDNVKVESIVDKDIASVETFKDEEEVAEIMRKYDLVAIPVVNVQGKLMGRITIDDVVDVMKELSEREKQLMSGISANVEHRDTVWNLSKARLPWLIIGVVGGMLGAEVIGIFEGELRNNAVMIFFIPLIMATGGNVGIQSSTIIVQGLANKTIIKGGMPSRIFKSFLVALINGVVISALVFGINILIIDDIKVGLVVAAALFCVVVLASLLGTITPLILDRFNINPALASGPFITTANDLIGIGVYLLIASIYL